MITKEIRAVCRNAVPKNARHENCLFSTFVGLLGMLVCLTLVRDQQGCGHHCVLPRHTVCHMTYKQAIPSGSAQP